jgi:hypothetical protein
MSNRLGSTPSLGHHRVHLRFEPSAQLHKLRSITHELSQLAHRLRRDPCFGETTQPQQVREIASVALIVLHPALAPVIAGGVRQMHIEPVLLQHIDRPIPAIRRLDHDRRVHCPP